MLTVSLDTPMPDALAAGAGTVLFVAGWCVADEGPVDALWVTVDGEERPVAAFGMPRIDVLRALGVPQAYRCGFWAWVELRSTPVALGLRARVGEAVLEAELASIAAEAPPAPVPARGRVAIAMATYDPPPELVGPQIESIRAQAFEDWVCVISDDCSDPKRFAALEALVAGDERFVLSRSERRLGFYRNFERALALVPEGAELVALADQDDVWHPDKVATLVAAMEGRQLVFSDARLVDRSGAVVSETYWERRENNWTDFGQLLVANTVTGAASLMRRDLLDLALPFPPAQFAHFHDHWLALCALARGEIGYVDRPLYDYVQHGHAVLGHAAANRVVGLRERLATLRDDPRDRIRLYRSTYFVDVARLVAVARTLLLREGPRIAPGKRRVLERFVAADRSLPAAARLWLAGAREYAGRPTTMGAERGLAYAFAWRRLLALSARDEPQGALRLDAVPPPDLAPRPGAIRPPGPARDMAEKIAPLKLRVRDDAAPRINLLIPTIDLAHLFGGYIAKFNLARRLAERGHRVRIVTVDAVAPLPGDWRAQVSAYEGLDGVFDAVEVAFGREEGLEVSRDDRWIATTWWTAHVAEAARRALDGGPFVYLVQEHEPFTFPAGTWSALAEQSYRFEHRALYSTELLREWFIERGIGAALESASFQNAITTVQPPALAGRASRRLLFYARPEPHAARNLFELGMLALQAAVADGTLDGWELRGIGTTALGRRLPLGRGAELELLSRAAQGDYGRLLGEHDVGVALMHTPHPSLVPIEMASAGMLTVTTRFGNKTPEAMTAISPNLLAAEPTVEGVAAGIAEAVAGVGDVERRLAGARVDWARDWQQAFPDELLERVEAWLG